MSNKLKTLSASYLEHFIAEKVGAYLDEECECTITELSTPNINSEEDIAETDERTMTFNVKISYNERN